MSPTHKEVKVIPGPSFAPTCVLITEMGHASPFYTYKFQELSNYIMKFIIQWALTPAIAL
jgi:hypothetical protein